MVPPPLELAVLRASSNACSVQLIPVVSLLTSTVMAAEVVLLPASSRARAVRVCEPLAAVAEALAKLAGLIAMILDPPADNVMPLHAEV